MTLLLPSLVTLVYTSCEPVSPQPVSPQPVSRARPPRAKSVTSVPNATWMAEVSARIQDASHQFFADPGQLRAEVPERGLTARFDDAGAHIGSGSAGHPITVRAARLGRARSNAAILGTAPGLGDCQEGKADPEGHCIARLEYANGGITEWWEAGSGGFEQGWVLSERPQGDGPVRIDVEVGGADAVVDGAGVELRGDDGSTLSVRGLKAWDARGDDVPVRFERADDGFRVVVDDEGAVYPVEVDPVYTSADWSVEGVGGAEEVANAVAGVGDTNGDGYDDVLVASDAATYVFPGSSTGVVPIALATLAGGDAADGAGDVNGDGYMDVVVFPYVYLGGVDGPASTPSATLPSGSSAVSGAGDVNGDGFDDIIAGGDDSAYVYLGSAGGLSSTVATMLIGDQTDTYTYFGNAVSGAGDVNGDGYDDVIVGDPMLARDWGTAYVYLGSAAGITSTVNAQLQDGLGVYFGSSVSGAGDIDGDGYDDVMVGAPIDPSLSKSYGTVYVYRGTSTGTSNRATTLSGEGNRDRFGMDVSRAGDVNQDGYADIIVGAPDASEAGLAYLYTGSSAGLSSTAAAEVDGWLVAAAGDTNGDGYDDVIVGNPHLASVYRGADTATLNASTALGQDGDHLGTSVANAGDVNDDGFDDLIVGAYRYDAFRGEALVYLGSAAGLGTIAVSTLTGAAAGDYFGAALGAAGDTDGDGYDDVIIGAWGSGEYGAAYTYGGSATGVLTTAVTLISGDAIATNVGYRVAGIGDVDGDGYDDVAVGTSPGPNLVRTYQGSWAGTSPSATRSLTLATPVSSLGSAGDINGDGYDDIVIGCGEENSKTGAAYVYVGSPSGTVEYASAPVQGEDTNDWFGDMVAAAGDVDGDGYDDLLVAVGRHDGGTGRVYVYHGAATGLSSTARTMLDGGSTGDNFGSWAASAGDANGDGYDDIIVAAPGFDGSGAVFVYPGSPTGVSSSPLAIATGLGLTAVAAAGDFNRDGLVDIVIGDSEAGEGAGRVSGYYGCVDADIDGFCEADDCDDADPSLPSAEVNPDATEVCDGIDNDCDGGVDIGAVDAPYWHADADGDGYTDPKVRQLACIQPEGFFEATEDDCNDTDPDIHPGAGDPPGDGIDQNCNGRDTPGKDCGCATTTVPPSALGLILLCATLVRRRR